MSMIATMRAKVVEKLNEIEAVSLAQITVLNEEDDDVMEDAEAQINRHGLMIVVYVEEESAEQFDFTARVMVRATEMVKQNRGAGGTRTSAREWLSETIYPALHDLDLEVEGVEGWSRSPAFSLVQEYASVDEIRYRLALEWHTVPCVQ